MTVLRYLLPLLLAGSSLATVTGPVINTNFPDPGLLSYNGTLYAYATNGNGYNIQLANSTDGGSSWTVLAQDALPDVGAWATAGKTWAPAPLDLGNGNFVLYYTANNPTTGSHCVGAATATNPIGPFAPQSTPIQCEQAGGGAIDPSPFRDTDGSLYIVFKVDGNNLPGGGGPCGNGDGEHPTPIMLQAMEADGVTPNGDPVEILDHSAADGPLIEAPALALVDGTYFLFFSSNCYNTDLYDISYATASSIHGPYTKAQAPIAPFLKTGNDGLTAPGGAMPLPDGSLIAFHVSTNLNPLTRVMYLSWPTWTSSSVSP